MPPPDTPATVRARALRCLASAAVAAAAVLARGLVGATAEVVLVGAFVVLAVIDWRRMRSLQIDAASPTQRACLAGQVGSVVLFAAVGSIGDPGLVGLVGFWVPAAVVVAAPAVASGWWTLRRGAAGAAAVDG